jgi:CheY-like chemotaxis protein
VLALIQERGFDLVLLDGMMPEMNRYQVLQRLKADPGRCDILLIKVSACNAVARLVRCSPIGAADYLPKPCNPMRLRARGNTSREKKRLRTQEVEYLRNVARVTNAAAALESGPFEPASLDGVAARPDALGPLARVPAGGARSIRPRVAAPLRGADAAHRDRRGAGRQVGRGDHRNRIRPGTSEQG